MPGVRDRRTDLFIWRYSGMEAYKQEFIHFMVDSDVLKFGDFTLKSGRKSRSL